MPKLPYKTLRVPPHDLDLWYDEDACTVGGVRGQYLGDEKKVLLDPRLPARAQMVTLFHEVMHAVLEEGPLRAGKEPTLTEDVAELVITEMERGITSVLQANPEYARHLLEVLLG